MRQRNFVRSAQALALGAVFSAIAGQLLAQPQESDTQVQTEAQRSFDIPAGSLAAALDTLARQAGLNLALEPDVTQGKSTEGLEGVHTPQQALQQLLEGTGLGYRLSDGGGAIIVAHDSDGAVQLEPVTITAIRGNGAKGETPQKLTILSREEIERQLRLTTNRGQILSNLIPGYSPGRQKLTNSGETFRGRGALIMIDGVPQSNPLRDSARDGYTIDLSMVERIEVIHGASAEHGLGATGGIINYVTKRANAGDFNQRVAVRLSGDDGLHSEGMGYKLDYQLSARSGDWDYLAAATLQERGIFFDGAGRTVGIDEISGEIQDSTSYNLFGKIGYWLDGEQMLGVSVNRFELESNHNYLAVAGDRTQGIPTTSREEEPPNDPPFNKSTTVNVSYEHRDWQGNQLNAQLYQQRFRARFGTHPFAFPYTVAGGSERLDQTQTESDKVGGKFTLSRDGLFDDHLDLTTGMDLIQDTTQQALAQTGRTYVPESVLRNAAAFVQGNVKVTEALSLHTGARYEHARIDVDTYHSIDRSNVTQDLVEVDGGSPDFSETLFNAGVIYRFADGFQAFANYSEGFGIPDVGRALRGIDEPGQDVDTLIQLQPIVTDNREIGFRVNQERYDFEISYYESDSDLGERLTQDGTSFIGKREKVEIRGVDVSGDLRLNEVHTLGLIYAFNDGESDTDGDGNVDTELSGFNIAPQRLTLKWAAIWNNRLSSFVQASRSFDKTFDDQTRPNLRQFNGYSLVDASLSYHLAQGAVSFSVQNLFDEDYISWYSQTARDGDNQFFAGRGRTFVLGYELDF